MNAVRSLHLRKVGKHKYNNAIVQHVVYDIILQEKENLSVKYEAYDNIDDEFDEDDMYKLDKMILDER